MIKYMVYYLSKAKKRIQSTVEMLCVNLHYLLEANITNLDGRFHYSISQPSKYSCIQINVMEDKIFFFIKLNQTTIQNPNSLHI